MDLKLFIVTAKQIAEEKNILLEKVIEVIERAMAVAYRKDCGRKDQHIIANIALETGEIKFWQLKIVVEDDIGNLPLTIDLGGELGEELVEDLVEELVEGSGEELGVKLREEEEKKIVFNPERHILLKDALKLEPGIKVGEILKTELPGLENYSRVAAQIAKQVITQEIRKIEKENLFNKYIKKQGEIISGVVTRIESSAVFIEMESVVAFLPKNEQLAQESYKIGERLKALVVKVEVVGKEVTMILSRTRPEFVVKLFSLEVPEVSTGQVEIKSIARVPGLRSKVAVWSSDKNIDPIGTLVGLKGTRIMAVIKEIAEEKIDVILWTDDKKQFIINALSPAKILSVEIDIDKATVFVVEDQVSLAIGKQGQNVRLASQLTGYNIDIKAIAQKKEEN